MLTGSFSNPNRSVLVIGDIITFLIFAAIGRRAHSMGSALDDITATAVPFLIAWFVAAPLTGAFRADATDSSGSAARRAALTWLLAFPLGYAIRAIMLGRLPHYTFAIVAGVFTFVALVAWRSAFARFVNNS
jgi:hypothetical protein